MFIITEEHRTGTASIFNIIPPKQHLYEPPSTAGGATTVAAESLIAQLHSLRRDAKIEKFDKTSKF
jgi:hypothetical protein